MNNLKAEREKKALTQDNMARILGISRAFYGLIENGKRQPSYGLAVKMAECLGAKVEAVFFNLEGFRMKQKKNGGAA